MKRLYVALTAASALLALALCHPVAAQVRQSGNVTPTHVACWTASGTIQDCGASTSPYPTTFGVLNGTGTDGLCVQSDKPTAAGYQRACLGATTAGGAVLSVQNFGTAATGGFQFQVNGSVQALPTITLPVTNGGFACFVGTSGTMADCGTSPTNVTGPGSATPGHVVSWNNAGGTQLADSGVFPMVGPGSTTNGNLVTWSGTGGLTLADSGVAASAVAFLSTNNVWTGTNTFQPVSGVPVTIVGPSSLSRNLDITQTFAGTDTSATHQLNNLAIVDTANLGVHVGNGFNISHVVNGGTFGSRQALQVALILNSASDPANTRHFYAAAQFGAQANSGDNGTNTGGGALGSIIGLNSAVTTNSGATNLAEASGFQVTMFTLAGSSVSQRSGIEISDNSGAGGIQGATFDDALVMGNVTGSPGWKIGWALDATNFGAAPIATTGTAIKTVGAQTMNTFLDASSATVTTFINGAQGNFVVDGNGNTQIKTTSSFGWVGNLTRISSPGDGVLLVADHTVNAGFGRLQLGGTTSSFPAISRNGAGIDFVLGDGTGHAAITAAGATFSAFSSVNANAAAAPSAAAGTTLQLSGADATNNVLLINAYGGNPVLRYQRADNTNASPSGVGNGDIIGSFQWQAYTSASAYSVSRAVFSCTANETWSSTANGLFCSLQTTALTTVVTQENFRWWGSGGFVAGNANVATDPGSGIIMATGFRAGASSGVSTTCTITAGNTYVFTGGILTTKGANCT